MNMMTRIEAHNADAAARRRTAKHFLDERGEPSDRCGPDLTEAAPIDTLVHELARKRASFSFAFVCACKDSGIDVSVMRTPDGEDRLMIGFPLDCQEDLRRPRYNALVALLERTERRKRDVIELMNMTGRFADNQPFASIEEAAREFTVAGGRIWVEPNGRCDESLPMKDDAFVLEHIDGFPLRRLLHRYEATLRRNGGRDAMAAFVRSHGRIHSDGWTVLDREGLLNV